MIPLFPAINLMLMPRTTEELPRRTLAAKAIRLHLLGEIALDYADTVLNIATRIRNPATKALCRTTKEVCLDYERFRQATSDPDQRRTEKRFGEDFEAICEPHLKKLSDGLSVEIDRLGLD